MRPWGGFTTALLLWQPFPLFGQETVVALFLATTWKLWRMPIWSTGILTIVPWMKIPTSTWNHISIWQFAGFKIERFLQGPRWGLAQWALDSARLLYPVRPKLHSFEHLNFGWIYAWESELFFFLGVMHDVTEGPGFCTEMEPTMHAMLIRRGHGPERRLDWEQRNTAVKNPSLIKHQEIQGHVVGSSHDRWFVIHKISPNRIYINGFKVIVGFGECIVCSCLLGTMRKKHRHKLNKNRYQTHSTSNIDPNERAPQIKSHSGPQRVHI